MKDEDKPEVWVKLEGVLTDPVEIVTNWAIPSPSPAAREIVEFAASLGRVFIYGDVCAGLKGQRAVQRWMNAHALPYYWVSERSAPPKDAAEVIDSWPTKTADTPKDSGGRTTPTPSTTPAPPTATAPSSPKP